MIASSPNRELGFFPGVHHRYDCSPGARVEKSFQLSGELRDIGLKGISDERVADVMISMDDPIPEPNCAADVWQSGIER